MDIGAILTVAITLYALVTSVFLVLENRRPQATLAWMLAFFIAPGVGVLIYFLFGRDRKAFSRQNQLLHQDLEAGAVPLLSAMLSRQDDEIARLEGQGASHTRLMRLVRRHSQSAPTRRHQGPILQGARAVYPEAAEGTGAAR